MTPLGPSYWHGWSPDGQTLAYCAQRDGEFDIYTIAEAGGEEKRLTTAKGLDDGPDYTPDGKQIYFNSERTGAMKIWRMNADGSLQEQVTSGRGISPTGFRILHRTGNGWFSCRTRRASPAIRPTRTSCCGSCRSRVGQPRVLATLFGGQGTINVPSWSPDSKSVAFVSYRMVRP